MDLVDIVVVGLTLVYIVVALFDKEIL